MEVSLNISKTENYARIKHFLRLDDSFEDRILFSAEFSIITSENDVFIGYICLFLGQNGE